MSYCRCCGRYAALDLTAMCGPCRDQWALDAAVQACIDRIRDPVRY